MKIKEILQKGFWTLSARVFGAGFTFLMMVLFARWLGVEDFGVFTLGLAIMTIFAVVMRWGTDQVLLKEMGRNKESNPSLAKGYAFSAIKLVLILGFLFFILIGFSHEYIANIIFNKPKLSEVLFFFGVLMIPFAINFTLAEAYKGMGRPALASYLQVVITPLVAVFLGYFMFNTSSEFSLQYSLVVFGVGIITSLGFSVFFWNKVFPPIKSTQVEVRKIFKEGKPMLLISSAGLVMAWSDMIILGIWVSSEELGIYAAASKIALVTSLILIAMNSITAPRYAKLYQNGDIKGLAKLAENSSKILLSLIIIPTIILCLFSEWIMGLFGSEFAVGATILIVLTVGQFINVVCGSVGYILTMTGSEVKMRNIMLFTAVINIVLSIVLVNFIGVIGVALATSFSVVLWNLLALLEVKNKLGFWTIPFSLYK